MSKKQSIAKKKAKILSLPKKNELKVVPLLVGIPCSYKFCFSGDVTINMQWLQKIPLREVEVYDKPFKGLAGCSIKKDLKVLQGEYYSLNYQVTNLAEEIAKKIESIPNKAAHDFSQMIRQMEHQQAQQLVISRSLTSQGLRISDYFEKLYQKSIEVVKIIGQSSSYFQYTIQAYNFDFEQIEKMFNGANIDLLKVIGCQINQPNTMTSRASSFIDNYLGLGFLVNPFDSRDVTQEFLLHTLDGVALKALFYQRVFLLLPHSLYVLKVRLIYFDDKDLAKLKLFRDTGQLQYPLQYSDLSELDSDQHFDYTPNYNLDLFFTHLSNQDKEILPKGVTKGIPLNHFEKGINSYSKNNLNMQNEYIQQEASIENAACCIEQFPFQTQKQENVINEMRCSYVEIEIGKTSLKERSPSINQITKKFSPSLNFLDQIHDRHLPRRENLQYFGQKRISNFELVSKEEEEEIPRENEEEIDLFDKALIINTQKQAKIIEQFINRYYSS